MNYNQAMDYIESTSQYGSVLGLDNMKELLNRLGNPQDKLKFIHIAGTNGKGSTGEFISKILAAAGLLTGRYISPVIFEYRERIQMIRNDTQYISEESVAKHLTRIQQVIEEMLQSGLCHPTPFEIETTMAFLEFVEKKCDMVVLEVGLGGRLDATNVILNTICAVITSVSMDHTGMLGDTLEEIAFEKSGIIKPGCRVVSYDQEDSIRKVLEKSCKEKQVLMNIADFTKITNEKHSLEGVSFDYETKNIGFSGIKTKLIGENQTKNAALAIETSVVLMELGYEITVENIQKGIENADWKGRFSVVSHSPLFVVDGAHNEAAAISLRKSIELYLKGKHIIYIMGVFGDKDYESILRNTADLADRIITITPENQRGLDSQILAEHALKYNKEVLDGKTISNGIKMALSMAEKDSAILAFGSLSFLGDIYHQMR